MKIMTRRSAAALLLAASALSGTALADTNGADTVSIDYDGIKASKVSSRIVATSVIDSYDSLDKLEAVKSVGFDGARIRGGKLSVTVPAKSVAALDPQ